MNLTIKDLPTRLHRKLKARAEANRRSLNGEVIDILEQVVGSKPLDVRALLAEVEEVHARIQVRPLDPKFLSAIKNVGRP